MLTWLFIYMYNSINFSNLLNFGILAPFRNNIAHFFLRPINNLLRWTLHKNCIKFWKLVLSASFGQDYLIKIKKNRDNPLTYRSLQVYQRSYSQVGHRVLSDLKRVSLLKLSDKILPGRSESLHSPIVKLETGNVPKFC